MVSKLTSITAVVLVGEACPPLDVVSSLLDCLNRHCVYGNVIIVANGASPNTSIELKCLIEVLPDITVIYLASKQHDDVARLVGIEHAIGDYVLLCTPNTTEFGEVDRLIDPLDRGYDLVIGQRELGPTVARDALNSILFLLFRKCFRMVAGVTYEKDPPYFRLLTRAAALHLISRSDAEVQVRSHDLGPGFPSVSVPLPDLHCRLAQRSAFRASISRAIRLLLTASTLPLRLVSALGLAGGALSATYMFYAILIWLLKPDVAPGWTTLSLQIAGMTFLFSLIFFLMAEYLVQIFAMLPSRSRRGLIARELTSQLPKRQDRLNVVDAEGQYQVGMPSDLARRI